MTEGQQLYDLVGKLFPITRSITGNGLRETLSIIADIIPLRISEVPSGTRVLDWEIPLEWNIRDAWVKNSKGEKVIDVKDSNLHVLNYSIPVHKKVGLAELKEHLFSLPEQPDLIPYRTSYHNLTWGYCMAHNKLKKLKEDTYEVMIDSTLKPGSLSYGEFVVEGSTKQEVLISTHVCHPSLANDNLTGIAVTAYLAKMLSERKTKYSYRFLFIPATIGSISWLSANEDGLSSISHGLVLTLLGDSSDFHYKRSRMGNAEIDKIVEKVLKDQGKPHHLIDFSPYGYDERQYCSPGFNLPVGRLTRKPHGEFPEYHTSADNLDFISAKHLQESLRLAESIVNVIESNKTFLNLNPKGEPQLGKRGLFKKVGGAAKTKDYHMAMLWVLNLSDGKHSLLDISVKSGLDYNVILEAAKKLIEAELLQEMN
jgi:aminopeptidase-like protein